MRLLAVRSAWVCSFAVAAKVVLTGCSAEIESRPEVSFAVCDVGQGLAQIVSCDGRALLIDAGPDPTAELLSADLARLGSPHVEAVILTHSDADHAAGLARLIRARQSPMTIFVSAFEDSLRVLAAASGPVDLRRLGTGDTVAALPGVRISCLWPARDAPVALPLTSETRNRYGLVLRLDAGEASALVTGDIDTVAQRALCVAQGWGMHCDVCVAPHHGSAGAVLRDFFGYVHAATVVVSYGCDNAYGHPSSALLDLAFETGAELLGTCTVGTVALRSNGEYWER